MKTVPQSLRILIISNYYPPFEIGGWEQLTADVARLLQERGHQVWVMSSNYRAAELTTPEPGVERVFHLESEDRAHYRPRYTLTYRRREQQNDRLLARRVADFSPDIIFINGMWNLPRSLARRAEQLCPGRVVYYIASPWPAEPDAHAYYWSDPAARWWRRRPKQLAGWLVRKWLLPSGQPLSFERVLCVSKYMQNFVIEQAGIPPANVQVVYNGIDPAQFPPRTGRRREKGLRLLYAGQLTPDKGVHTTIEGLAQAVQTDPLVPLTLTIVGGGAPGYVESLQRRIRELDLSRIVTLTGQVARDEMPDILAGHDALLFPSIWPEPLARVVQEAMACGLVVIGTTTGGTPELLREGETGLTFEAEDAAGLGRQIGRLAADPLLYDQLAQAARKTVETCFTQQRMVDEIETCFHDQMGSISQTNQISRSKTQVKPISIVR